MYILWMYHISLLLLPPDGFVLCYIGLLVLTLWRFGDDVISSSPGKGCYKNDLQPGLNTPIYCSNIKWERQLQYQSTSQDTWAHPSIDSTAKRQTFRPRR